MLLHPRPAVLTQGDAFPSVLSTRSRLAAACMSAKQQQQQQADSSHQQPAGPRVMSIQSSVVHGYVGNKCAMLPLQLLGFDVDPVLSVQFSNHTGYPTIKGRVFDGAHLSDLMAGLKANGLLCHTHILSGYIGSWSLLEAVAQAARDLKQANPQVTYVCDPVLGDEGNLYVKPELVEAYKQHIVPLANLLTPNQFEAECLSGVQVSSEADALEAADVLHGMGPNTVIITSMSHMQPRSTSDSRSEQQSQQEQQQSQQQQASAQPDERPEQQQQYITLVASTRIAQEAGAPARFRLKIPQLPGYFTGTGDLLAALLLAWTHHHPHNLATAVEKAVAGLQGVLALTAAAAGPEVLACKDIRSAAVFKAKELRLVQGQHLLVKPDVHLKAEPL